MSKMANPIHVVEYPSETKQREKLAHDRSEYRHRHSVCPQCGSKDFEQTCMGFVMTDLETHIDRNRVSCRCGWRGIVHELVS